MSALVLGVVALFVFYLFLVPFSHPYVIQETDGTLVNPVLSLTDSQALGAFDSSFVFYLLYVAHAYELHATPVNGELPELMVTLEDGSYCATITRGVITVMNDSCTTPDVLITSTRTEVISLLRTPDALADSFASGRSSFTVVASRATLLSKGYLRLYMQL